MIVRICKSFILSGERGRNRTYNLLIKSQLLCQLSYAPFSVADVAAGEDGDPFTIPQFHTSIVATSTDDRVPSITTMPLSVT